MDPAEYLTDPIIIPYCAFCALPAERYYVIEPPNDERYKIALVAVCCDNYQGAYVTLEEVRRLKRTGDKLKLEKRT